MTATAGIKWVFISIGLLMIITTVFAHFLLPGTETIMTRRLDNQQSDASLLSLFTKLPLFYAYLGSFALMFSQGVLAYMLPLKVQALQYGSEMSGLLLSTFSLTAILIFVLPTNKLFDRFTHEKTMTLGLAVLGVALLLVSLTDHHTLLFAIMILYGIGFAFIFPSINALIAQYTSNRERGKAFGLFYAFFSLGVVVGSLVIGALELSPNGAFMLGACVVFVCSLIVLIFILRAQPKEPINR